MVRQPLFLSPNYRAFVRGIRALHRLAIAGKDESPEADAVRDSMDAPWEALSEIERIRARGLSEDLYSISDPPNGCGDQMDAQIQDKLNNALEVRQRGEWDRALEQLRGLDGFVAPALMSFLRGSIWLYADDPETALLFFEHALQLQPENGNYLAIFLHALNAADPRAAQEHARQIVANPNTHSPVAVARAADILFRATHSLADAETMEAIRQLIPVFERAISHIEFDYRAI
jgi:tetratricopeptide (TPR) repeat protein